MGNSIKCVNHECSYYSPSVTFLCNDCSIRYKFEKALFELNMDNRIIKLNELLKLNLTEEWKNNIELAIIDAKLRPRY